MKSDFWVHPGATVQSLNLQFHLIYLHPSNPIFQPVCLNFSTWMSCHQFRLCMNKAEHYLFPYKLSQLPAFSFTFDTTAIFPVTQANNVGSTLPPPHFPWTLGYFQILSLLPLYHFSNPVSFLTQLQLTAKSFSASFVCFWHQYFPSLVHTKYK